MAGEQAANVGEHSFSGGNSLLAVNQVIRIAVFYPIILTHFACTPEQGKVKTTNLPQNDQSSREDQTVAANTDPTRTKFVRQNLSLLIPKGYVAMEPSAVIRIKKEDGDEDPIRLFSWSYPSTEALVKSIRSATSSISDIPTPVNEHNSKEVGPNEVGGTFKNHLIGEIKKHWINGLEVFEAAYEHRNVDSGESSKWYLTYVVYKRTKSKLFVLYCDQQSPDSLARKILLSARPL